MNQKSTAQNYQQLKQKLGHATLVAVSKKSSVEEIEFLYHLGQRDFGENRVQELVEKSSRLKLADLRWHFIGPLQSNKMKALLQVPKLEFIHSVDSEKHLEQLNEKASQVGSRPKLFLQVKTSPEKEKQGFEKLERIPKILQASSLPVVGLMTISPIRTDHFEEDARKSFKRLRQKRDELDRSLKLSMGMSRDYQIALEEGADMVRIGSLLFGK